MGENARPVVRRLRSAGLWSLLTILVALVFVVSGVTRPEAQPTTASTAAPSEQPAILPIDTIPSRPPQTAAPEATPEPTPDPTPAAVRNAPSYRIEIPRLGVNLPIAEGNIVRDVVNSQTPEHYAFHLPGTSMFGGGNTYVYAHARAGMFLSLWDARIGDVVIVRAPTGTREYVVAEIHPRVPPTQTSWAGPTTDTRLTLQTSTGPHGDDPRFVVVARPRS